MTTNTASRTPSRSASSSAHNELSAEARHELPTHLHVEDRLIAGLTVRQTLMVSAGISLGYSLWQQLAGLQLGIQALLAQVAGQQTSHVLGVATLLSLLVRVTLAALPAGAFALLALARPADRPLEEWLVIALRYATLPKTLVWRSDGADSKQMPLADERSYSEDLENLEDDDDQEDDEDAEFETDVPPEHDDEQRSGVGKGHEKGHRRT